VAEAFQRLAVVRGVGVAGLAADVPAGRLRTLARYGLSAKAQTLRRMSPNRRTATLLAALWQLELDATDDALILLDQVVDLLLSHATREHKDRPYAQLPDLDGQIASQLQASRYVPASCQSRIAQRAYRAEVVAQRRRTSHGQRYFSPLACHPRAHRMPGSSAITRGNALVAWATAASARITRRCAAPPTTPAGVRFVAPDATRVIPAHPAKITFWTG